MKGKISIILGLALFLAVGLFMATAQPASAQVIDVAGPGAGWVVAAGTATGGFVGQQFGIAASTSGGWNAGTSITVNFAGQPVIITNSGDDPLTMVTDGNAVIATGTYFFRVPKAIRRANQIVFSGQGTIGGNTVTISRPLNFIVGTGINATKGTSPLPDWSTSAEKVGKNLIIYGTAFGSSGTDSGIVVTWDGSVIASGISADSDGRWETTIKIPESTGTSGGEAHRIQATSIKLAQATNWRFPDDTLVTSTTAMANYRVKPGFTLTPSTANVGDTVNITGFGWAGTTAATERTIAVTISSGATSRTATTTPVTLKTSGNGSFSGSFKIPEFPIGVGGPVNVTVTDSAGSGTETEPMVIGRSVDITLSPSSGLGAISIEASGFTAGSSISIFWGTQKLPTVPTTISSDANGNFTAIVSVPTTTPGTYDIKAMDSSAEGRTKTAKFTVPTLAAAADAKPGPAGPAGPPGPAGSEGKAGAAGKAGKAGDAGPAGKAGADGKAGPAGPAGAAGAAGAAGKTGAAGASGPAGKDAPMVMVIITLLISIVAIIISLVVMVKKPAAPKA